MHLCTLCHLLLNLNTLHFHPLLWHFVEDLMWQTFWSLTAAFNGLISKGLLCFRSLHMVCDFCFFFLLPQGCLQCQQDATSGSSSGWNSWQGKCSFGCKWLIQYFFRGFPFLILVSWATTFPRRPWVCGTAECNPLWRSSTLLGPSASSSPGSSEGWRLDVL